MSKNRESELLGALERISGAAPLDPARIAVLICPPVSRIRISAAAGLPAWMGRRFGFESDYLRNYTERHGDARQYWEEVGKPVLQTVALIRGTRARTILNARFRDLESVVADEPLVVFLVAHHIEETGEIEFSGSRRHWLDVQTVVARSSSGERSCFLLDICNSAKWREELRRAFPNLKPAGGVSQMNLPESLRMIALFLAKSDGRRSFEDAWALAESVYWNPEGRNRND
jgi:hypothetical protein